MSYASEQAILNTQFNAAMLACSAEEARAAPHVLMRPELFADGTAWCALYGENLAVGVSGFGETPAAAMAAFDKEWREQRTPTAARLARTQSDQGR